MRFIDAAEIRRVLTFPMLVDGLAAAHRRAKVAVLDGHLGREHALYFVRSAVDEGRFMASKLITSFPGNLAGGGLPAVQAVVVLFNGSDGRPLAVMDGTEITYWRTAADSALGARTLANPEPAILLVVGAGEMAKWLVRAHRAVRPSLGRVLIWNRTKARAEAVAALLRGEGVEAEATEDLDAATRIADVITTCTRSHAPLVKGANLKPGAHLDLVGGYTPETREADDAAAIRASIFVDRRESAMGVVGDIVQPIRAGVIAADSIAADLAELTRKNHAGWTSDQEITLFKSVGASLEDLAGAIFAFEENNRDAADEL